jgi:hypothetical protein
MAYLDLGDDQQVADPDAENRRRVLAAIVSRGSGNLLGRPPGPAPPSLTTGAPQPAPEPTQPSKLPDKLTPTTAPTQPGPPSTPLSLSPSLPRPPQSSDFPTRKLSLGEKFGAVGYGVLGGLPGAQRILGRPQAEADRGYTRALQDYGTEVEAAKLPADIRQKNALASQEESKAQALLNPPDKPDRTEAKTVETGEGVWQWNPDTNRYDIKVGPPKSDAKEPRASEEDKAVKDWMDARKLPDTPQNRDRARKDLKVAPAVQIQTTAAETKEGIKNANLYYRWTDPQSGKIKTGRGTKVPSGVDAEPIGDDKAYATHVQAGRTSGMVQTAFNRIAQNVDEHPELWDNATARNIMTTTLEQIDRASAGILVAGTGGQIPLPSGTGDIINNAMRNNLLDKKTASALSQYIADYKSMKDMAVVLQMEMQNGRVGRGAQEVFKAITNQVPNGSTANSTEARRQASDLQSKQDVLAGQYRDEDKIQPYKMKSDTGGQSQRQPVIVDGKTVGYATRDEYNAGKMYPKP